MALIFGGNDMDFGYLGYKSGKEASVLGYVIEALNRCKCRDWYIKNNFYKTVVDGITTSSYLDLSKEKSDPPDFFFNNSNLAVDIFIASDLTLKKGGKNIEFEQFEERINSINNSCGNDKVYFRKFKLKGFHDVASFERYIWNLNNTINKHFKLSGGKNPNLKHWNKADSTKYKGFIVIDLGHLYVDSRLISEYSGKGSHLTRITNRRGVYYPWMDERVMENFYKSDCDFVVWWCPRRYGVLSLYYFSFNEVNIVDCRDKHKKCLDYKDFISSENLYYDGLISYSECDYNKMGLLWDGGLITEFIREGSRINDCDRYEILEEWFFRF